MKLFGFDIRRTNAATSDAGVSPDDQRLFERILATGSIKTIARKPSLASQITFPEAPAGEWPHLRYQKAVRGVFEMFEGRHFNICPVTEIVEVCSLQWTKTSAQNYNDLRAVHCMNWIDFPDHMREQVPHMLTHIFSEGRLPASPVVQEVELLERVQ